MKVGDLVAKQSQLHEKLVGIVVGIEASETHIKVIWGNYGTFWSPINKVEVISETR